MTTVCVMCGKIIHGARHPAACGECAHLPHVLDALDRARSTVPRVTKPTIKLRIRVGVTADGTWLAMGSNLPDMIKAEDERDAAFQQALREDGAGPVVAWRWITADVPMPEVEQGETKGEVEHG